MQPEGMRFDVRLPERGDVIYNPVQGEMMEFLEVGGAGEQSALRVAMTVEPQASGPPPHIHPHSTESFEVHSGAMTLRTGRDERILPEGQSITVASRTPHTFWNHTDEAAVVTVEWQPGMAMAGFLDRWFQLARDGAVNEKGMAGPLQTAVLFDAYLDSIAIPVLPIGIQRGLFRVLTVLGRRREYRA